MPQYNYSPAPSIPTCDVGNDKFKKRGRSDSSLLEREVRRDFLISEYPMALDVYQRRTGG